MIRLENIIPTLYVAQQGRCFHCDKHMPYQKANTTNNRVGFTREHLVPRSTLTKYRHNNLVLAHYECNQRHGQSIPTREQRRKRNAIYKEAHRRVLDKRSNCYG